MGKIRVKTLGDEAQEKEQAQADKARREEKKLKKKAQQSSVVEETELKSQVEQANPEDDQKTSKDKKNKETKSKSRSKRYQALRNLVDRTKLYSLTEAIDLLKKTSTTKFDGTVEAHINLNPELIDKDKKSLSGSVTLPHGTGKKRVIAIADEALIDKVSKGIIDFDVLVAHPSLMPKLAKVARVLGPKGLMPNPKNGTVTADPQKRAKELEGGEMNWKTEPDQPVLHQALGKVSFTEKQIEENIKAFVKSIGQNKVHKLTLSSTMGPGIKVNTSTL